jgi:iron complex outermembrane receptor protein
MATDPVSNDLIMLRRPIEIDGYEVSASYNVTDEIRLNALFSHTEGFTRSGDDGPLDREMGINDIGPDKLIFTADWGYSERGNVVLGSRTLMGRDINEGLAGEEQVDGYTLLDLTVNYGIGDGVLSLGIDNLTDKFYILSSSQVPGFLNYFSGRGREVTLGYSITF